MEGKQLVAGIGLQPFSFGELDDNLAQDWQIWSRSFELFIKAYKTGNTNDENEKVINKCALLLHHAGAKVQSIYDSLEDVVDDIPRGPLLNSMNPHLTEYEKMIAKLDNFFAPKRGSHYEQYIFSLMVQKESEKIEFFAIRLKQQANRCNYGDQMQQNMKNQLIKGCLSTVLREKLLEHGGEHFDKLLSRAKTHEVVNEQKKIFEQKTSYAKALTEPVYKVDSRESRNKTSSQLRNNENIICNRCGYKGHRSTDDKCPAKGKTCNKCSLIGHFAQKCKTKNVHVSAKRVKPKDDEQPEAKRYKEENVKFIADINDSDENVFCVSSEEEQEKIKCNIGGVEVSAIIDSGTKRNLIDEKSWIYLKSHSIKMTNKQKSDRAFKAYGGNKLATVGMFTAELMVGNKSTLAVFYITKGQGDILIGKITGKLLGILKIEENVNQVAAVEGQFSKIKGVMVDIPIRDDVKPVIQPYRRIPVPLQKRVDEQVNNLLKQGIVEKVTGSPTWVSPLVVVPKHNSDDEIRICVDMRRANQAVNRENHPLPTFEDFLPELENAEYFSKIDIKNAFHQVEIAQDSRSITTFITRKGLFRYKRLMFGITCAPEIFQKILEQVLSGLDGCVNFIDDILVSGPTKNEHDRRLRNVMKRLKDFNITLNMHKCIFGVKSIEFLGHKLSPNGIKPSFDKIEAVKQFRRPETAEETRSFLGLVNYVGKFIPNLATVTDPLRKLTRNNVSFEWGQDQEKAFKRLKQCMCSDMILGFYNVADRTQVIADASPFGLGAILIQFNENGPRIIMYASKSLSNVEKRYAQTEKEALALVWAVERFHHYLFGRMFELVTDHKPLETIFGPKSKPCARIERWVMRLQSYKYTIVYKPGKSNIADPLSRLVQPADTSETCASQKSVEYVNWVIQTAEPKAMKLKEIDEQSQGDATIDAVRKAIDSDEWSNLAAPYKFVKTELCFAGNILLRGTRIIIPKSLQERILNLAHEGHPGMTKMKHRLRAKTWWPKMDEQIEQYIKKCIGCIMVSAPSAPEPMKRYELPSKPWQHLAMDYMGVLPSGHHLLVVVDYYSRFIEVEIMTKIYSSVTIERLKEMFARFGLPISIAADNAKQFVSQELKDYCSINNIELRNTIPYWPQMNGEVEIQNKSLLKFIQIAQNTGKNWRDSLHEYLTMYRSTPQLTTMKSPAELMFGRTMRDKLPSIYQSLEVDQDIHDKDKLNKEKGKEYGDKKRKASKSNIEEGDKVLLKRQVHTNKLDSTFEPNIYKVTKKNGGDIIVESVDTGVKYRRNIAHLKKIPDETLQALQGSSLRSSITGNLTTASVATPINPAGTSTSTIMVPTAAKRQRKATQRYRDYVLYK